MLQMQIENLSAVVIGCCEHDKKRL